MKFLPLAVISIVYFSSPTASNAQTTPTTAMTYPPTATVDVTDDYFGRKVQDPYRWLEDTESDATAAWIKAENEVTQTYLQSLPQREPMRARLEKLWNYERYGLPAKKGDFYLYSHNDGLQDQSILYKSSSLDSNREELIDPMTFSKDGTVALAGTEASDNGELIAYGLADGGSDWRTWKVRDGDGKN